MLLTKFRTQITYILLVTKFTVIGTIFLHFFSFKFTFTQAKELLFIVLPLFTVYLTIVMKFLGGSSLESLSAREEKFVTGPLVVIGRWIPVLFAVYMILVLTLPSAGTAESEEPFRQMKEMIGWGEAIFGIYIGYIVQATFQKATTTADQNEVLLATLKGFQVALTQPSKKPGLQAADTSALKELIAQGKIEEAIESLKAAIQAKEGSNDLLNQVINLSAQYRQYAERRRLNLTDNDLVANQVMRGLLEIIDEL